jgi:peptidoglycan/LPS O-acetylase OafA/YrhL
MSSVQYTYVGQSRYAELDALRGIAAVLVVIWHFFCTVFAAKTSFFFSHGIFFMINGRASVILFFLLSGFVLSLPFSKEPKPQYIPFALRRICRIYLPYVVGIGIAILVRTYVATRPIPGLFKWFNDYCGAPFSAKIALEHLLLIGNIHSDVYNNAIWSLIHEMRISLLFPLLFILVRRAHPAISIAACFLFTGIAHMSEIWKWETSHGWETGYLYSLHVASLFIIGILIAQHKESLVRLYQRLARRFKIALLLVSIILFWISMDLWLLNMKYFLLYDYGSALGAFGIIVITLGSGKASTQLTKPFFKLLGDISYSIYLNHIAVLYLVFYLLYPALPIPVIGVILLVSVIVFSFINWMCIERPSIALGRMLAKKTSN